MSCIVLALRLVSENHLSYYKAEDARDIEGTRCVKDFYQWEQRVKCTF